MPPTSRCYILRIYDARSERVTRSSAPRRYDADTCDAGPMSDISRVAKRPAKTAVILDYVTGLVHAASIVPVVGPDLLKKNSGAAGLLRRVAAWSSTLYSGASADLTASNRRTSSPPITRRRFLVRSAQLAVGAGAGVASWPARPEQPAAPATDQGPGPCFATRRHPPA